MEIPIWRTGMTSSSSSRIGSSGDVQANPIDSSVSRSTSRGTPGLLAHLPVGAVRRDRPAVVRGGLQERERQPAGPDGRGDPVHRQPGPLAGQGQADLAKIDGQERGRLVPGDQDAEVDHAADLGLAHARQLGQLGPGQRLHGRHPTGRGVGSAERDRRRSRSGRSGQETLVAAGRRSRGWSRRWSRRWRSRSRVWSRPRSSAGCQPRTPVARSTTMATRRRVQWSEANPWACGGCCRVHLTV